ncbi:MAG: DUF488 domain-containing protein [Acidobacteriia bacterium]|nr:DUF488 domain-containing protein [Terriglobia bacterium]
MPVPPQGDPPSPRALHTVGHSNLELPQFLNLLKDAGVELLIDVRSRPQSGRFPQFNQAVVEKQLESEGISYLFLGEELGGRPDDPSAYLSDGRVNYRARRKSYAFSAGLERVVKELQSRTLALMCAEEDPLECHRFLMICPELVASGIQPRHIRKGSRIESQEAAETRLLESTGFGDVAANTLFPAARAEALEKAYELQAAKFALRVNPVVLQVGSR